MTRRRNSRNSSVLPNPQLWAHASRLTLGSPVRSVIRTLTTIMLTTMFLAIGGLAGSAQEEPRVQTVVFDRAIQRGEVVRLDATCDCDAMRATATVFGQDVPLFPIRDGDAWRGLIGIDLDIKPGAYPVAVVVDRGEKPPVTTTRDLAVVTKRFPIRRLRVPAHFVNPPASAIERIQDEADRLRTLFLTVTRPRQWHRPFQAPARAPTSGNFGMRSVFNGQPRSPHSGVDFRSKAGSPVAASATGVVTAAESFFFTGNTVVIDHGLGLYSLLAHLSKFAVKTGDRVQRGQIVGFVGATGRVSGPHLHWSVRLNGARVDPLSLIAATNELKEPSE